MLIACSTCSGPGGASRSPGEQKREPQRKRIRVGLVTPLFVANLPEVVKPVTGSERNEHMLGPGEPGRLGAARVERLAEEPGRVEAVGKTQQPSRMHKAGLAVSEVGRVHSSEEAGNDRRAKGRDRRSAAYKVRRTA